MSRRRINSFVFFDLETTGLIGEKPRITEITMLSIHRSMGEEMCRKFSKRIGSMDTLPDIPRVVNKLTLCVNPMKPINPQAAEITGMYNDVIEHQKDFDDTTAQQLNLFLSRLEAPVCLVAHNGNGYDFPLLVAELQSIGSSLLNLPNGEPILCVDTLVMFRQLNNDPGPFNRPNPYLKPIDTSSPSISIQSGHSPSPELANGQESGRSTELTEDNEDDCPGNDQATPSRSRKGEESPPGMADRKKRRMEMESKTPGGGVKNGAHGSDVRRALFPEGRASPPAGAQKKNVVVKWPSYKQSDIHKRIVGLDPLESHRSEDDCVALARVFWLTAEAASWADENAIEFGRFKPLYDKPRTPLPRGQFPCPS